MIVRERPGPLRLLLAWKGSVVPHILPHILLTGMFAAAVTWVSRHHYLDGMVDYTLLPFTIMGIDPDSFTDANWGADTSMTPLL